MNILYYNLQLGSFDGSNAHATGMLAALRHACGEKHVMVANAVHPVTYSHQAQALKARLGKLLDPVRVLRKHNQARDIARDTVERVRESGFEPEVLLARATLYDTAPQRIAQKLGCKLVVEANTPFEYECCDIRGTSIRALTRDFEQGLLKAADGVYAVSTVLKEMYLKSYGIAESKIKVVPNGYSSELYRDFEDRERIRQAVRVEQGIGGAFAVVFVGSLQTWHGIERLINISKLLPDIAFWVLGDGPVRDAVKACAARQKNFMWFGNVDPETMKRVLYAADLGVMPYEALDSFYFSPLKMFDMVGAGLPFIGADIGQIGEVARNQLDDGFLVGSTEASVYAERIAWLAQHPDELAAMRTLVSTARPCMTWDVRAAALTEWLERL